MGVVARVLFFTVVAWLLGPGEGEIRLGAYAALQELTADLPQLATLATCWALGAMLCFVGAFNNRARHLCAGVIGTLLLPWAAELTPFWKAASPLPSWTLVPLLVAGAVLLAYARAFMPTFRSKGVLVHDGGDHIALDLDSKQTIYPRGRVLCERKAHQDPGVGYSGGGYRTYNTGSVTGYSPISGPVFGTVTTSQWVDAPGQVYTTWTPTGKWRFTLEEVGEDHSLRLARCPADVALVTRPFNACLRQYFDLAGWTAFSFSAWCRVHARSFYQPDRSASRRIARAAAGHRAAMKARFGRFKARHLVLDHSLELVSFVGLGKDRCFVQVANPSVSLVIKREEVDQYLDPVSALRVPGCEKPIPTGQTAKQLGGWVQLQEVRRSGSR